MAINTTQERLSIISMAKPFMPQHFLPVGSAARLGPPRFSGAASRPVAAWLYHMTYGTGVVRLYAPFTLVFTGLSTDELIFTGYSTDSLIFTGYSTDEIVKGG